MRDSLWVNADGTVCVVTLDDNGNRVDLPQEAPKAEAPAKPKPKKPRFKRR